MLTTLASAGLLAQALPGGLVGLAVIFFIIAILAYVLGARGVAGMSAGIGRTLLFVFLVLAFFHVALGVVPVSAVIQQQKDAAARGIGVSAEQHDAGGAFFPSHARLVEA